MTADNPVTVEVDRLRFLVHEASDLRLSNNLMVASAARRVAVILTDLLTELAPVEFPGPWQSVD